MYRRRLATALAFALPLTFAPLGAGAAQQPAPARPPDFRWEKALAAGNTVSLHNLNGDVDRRRRPPAGRWRSWDASTATSATSTR